MDNKYCKIQKRIAQLCESIGDRAFCSLLLVQHFLNNSPAVHLCKETDDFKEARHNGKNPVFDRSPENALSAFVSESLAPLDDRFPYIRDLIEQTRGRGLNLDESALQELMYLLSETSREQHSMASVFEGYLRSKASARSAASGDIYTPRHIAHCMSELLNLQNGTIYDPCCGSGALLFGAIHGQQEQCFQLFGQTQDEESFGLCQMNLILHDQHVDLGRGPANTLLDDQHKDRSFDYIVSNPPFNIGNWQHDAIDIADCRWRYGVPPRSNANFAWLQHILSHLNQTGRAAVILPNSTLTTRVRAEAGIRGAMVKDNRIEAIISLPPGLFYTTNIPCCIWLLTNDNRRKEEILFIDAVKMTPTIAKSITATHIEQLKELLQSYRQNDLCGRTEWYAVATLETIARNDYLLSPNLYTAVLRVGPADIKKERETLQKTIGALSELLAGEEILTCIEQWKQATPAKSWNRATLFDLYEAFIGVMKGKEAFGHGYPLLKVKTVLRSPYVPDTFSAYVEVSETEKAKYGIKQGDVFLNRTSETAADLATCCVATTDHAAVYDGFIKRLRPRDRQTINPLYAACYFRSDIYRWEVEKVSTVYTTYASIDNRKLSKIAFYYPDPETQSRIGDTVSTVFQYSQGCALKKQRSLLKEFARLLIQQYITYPVLCIQNKEGDYHCK